MSDHAERGKPSAVLAARLLGAGLLVFGGAAWGLVLFFTDLGTAESVRSRVLLVTALYTVVPFLVGVLVPRWWYVALLTAAGPVGLGILSLIMRTSAGGPPPFWSYIVAAAVGVPVVVTLAARIGAATAAR
jgi:hypothetical protein